MGSFWNKKTDEHFPFGWTCMLSKLNYSSQPSWSRHQVVIRLKRRAKADTVYTIYIERERKGEEKQPAVSTKKKRKRGNIPYHDKTLISLPSSEKMRQSNHSNTSDFVAFLLFFLFFLIPQLLERPFRFCSYRLMLSSWLAAANLISSIDFAHATSYRATSNLNVVS